MHVLMTGGTGQAGRFVTAALLAKGHQVTLLGRAQPPAGAFAGAVAFRPWALGAAPGGLPAADALVHGALDHAPGRYRGGEGDDPEGFWRRNVEGSLALLGEAAGAGIGRAVFLSSRAVYGPRAPGVWLEESDAPVPDTLYGAAKRAVEAALPGLAAQGLAAAALRATGVYGTCPGWTGHKWRALFAEYLRGDTIAPRVASELHGADLAQAVLVLLAAPAEAVAGRAFNASDLVLDRADLLGRLAALTGCPHSPPEPADSGRLNVMRTERLRALGWRPGGEARLVADLPRMAELARADVARGLRSPAL